MDRMLRLAREVQLQAILLDVVMPGTDGWQVLHDLKASPATSNILWSFYHRG
jgi:CheY-like chemotaxis protein